MKIIRLEKGGLLITESIEIIKKVDELLEITPNNVRAIIKNKMEYVLNKNSDLKTVLNISEILDGKETSKGCLLDELTADD